MADQPASAGDLLGRDVARIDARLKVTGQARYPSDEVLSQPAYAFLVTSRIARGAIRAMRLDAAYAVPGVLDILHHGNVGDQVRSPPPLGGGASTTTLESPQVWHDGQIVAVVVADSYEVAREAAFRVEVDYDEQTPTASFDSDGTQTQLAAELGEGHEDPKVGDAETAYASSWAQVDAHYATPTQHHNPIELFTTSCVWHDEQLTVYEPSQFVHGLAAAVATQLGIAPRQVRVISRYVGGAFGSKGFATARTAWIALAARRLNRPVKLVATREQGFTIATYRAETRHRVRLGASPDGRLQALIHEGWELTSRPSNYKVAGTDTTTRVYACPNIASRVHIVHADRNTPGFMRAPPETPYMFALESAIDELAVRLSLDPVELRRRNDTQYEPIRGLPFTSRQLMPCFDAAATAFGWAQRDPRPGRLRDGEWRVGWGCATACYPSKIGPACARVSLGADGHAKVQTGAQDIGTGAYTAIAITVADALGLSPAEIEIEAGDSALPAAGLAAGSSHTASVCNVVARACEQLRARLVQLATRDGPLAGHERHDLRFADGCLIAGEQRERLAEVVRRSGAGALEAYAEHLPHGAPPDGLSNVSQGKVAITGGAQLDDRIQYAFGAEFVEVRVHARTGEVRVPRIVGAFATGRIVSARTAHSQLMGGMIWGIASALHEATDVDPRTARYINNDLAEYLLATNADIGKVEVIMLPERDEQVNPLGIKGIGEVGNVGTNAAVANAVYHATGRRIRQLPIRIEDLL